MHFWKFNGQNLEGNAGSMNIIRKARPAKNQVFNVDQEQVGKFGLGLVTPEKYNFDLNENFKFEDTVETVQATFLCVVFLEKTLITSGDDGFLYIWD